MIAKKNIGLWLLLIWSSVSYAQARKEKEPTPHQVECDYFFIEGEKEFILGHYDKAIEQYKKVVELDLRAHYAYYKMASCYATLSQDNDLNRAMTYLEKAIAMEKDVAYYQLAADIALRQHADEKAIDYLTVVAEKTNTARAWEQLAQRYLNLNKPEQAYRALQKAEDVEGINERIMRMKKIILLGLHQPEKAADEWGELCALFPTDETYWIDWIALASSLPKKEKIMTALALHVQQYPEHRVVKNKWLELSGQAVGLEQVLDPTLSLAEKITWIDTEQQKSNASSNATLKKAVDTLLLLHPKEIPLLHAAARFYQPLSLPKFIELKRRALYLGDAQFDTFTQLLESEKKANAYDSLERHAAMAIDNFPGVGIFLYYQGIAARQLQKQATSITLLEQACRFPSEQAWERDARFQLAELLIQQNKLNDAQHVLQTTIATETSPTALNLYGDILYQVGQTEQAVVYWKKAKEAGMQSDALELKIKKRKIQ